MTWSTLVLVCTCFFFKSYRLKFYYAISKLKYTRQNLLTFWHPASIFNNQTDVQLVLCRFGRRFWPKSRNFRWVCFDIGPADQINAIGYGGKNAIQGFLDRLGLSRQIQNQTLASRHPHLAGKDCGRHIFQTDSAHLLTANTKEIDFRVLVPNVLDQFGRMQITGCLAGDAAAEASGLRDVGFFPGYGRWCLCVLPDLYPYHDRF